MILLMHSKLILLLAALLDTYPSLRELTPFHDQPYIKSLMCL